MTGAGPAEATAALIAETHAAAVELAREFHRTAERQAADHGTHHPCRTLAAQCAAHAERLRAAAARHGRELSPPRAGDPLGGALDTVRHTASELRGRHASSGELLLRDLRRLFLAAQEVAVLELMLVQVAQAVRDGELLAEARALREETLGRIDWVRTRLADAAPQVLAVAG
ncbi:hypothetical protein [Streptomyces zingiberis]|uniref:DUF892 family protein n=1 Tax=Streptomyces zingiberis TaxID=2053010 RepID=A0ABX1BRK3_9ACTN|nr:hypothetical protein [Streptomyces zingiberis]NJQ00347.1 hypothetical protein [Streptomyces zingiberis]